MYIPVADGMCASPIEQFFLHFYKIYHRIQFYNDDTDSHSTGEPQLVLTLRCVITTVLEVCTLYKLNFRLMELPQT